MNHLLSSLHLGNYDTVVEAHEVYKGAVAAETQGIQALMAYGTKLKTTNPRAFAMMRDLPTGISVHTTTNCRSYGVQYTGINNVYVVIISRYQ